MDLVDFLVYLTFASMFAYFLSYVLSSYKKSRSRNLPPGPSFLTILRNIHHLSKPHSFFSELAKVYGPVMCVQLGCKTIVVISSPSMAKEALQKKDTCFSERSLSVAMDVIGHYETAMVFSPPNAHWRDLKKLCNMYLFSRDRLDATRGIRGKQVRRLLAHVQDCCNSSVAVNISQAVFSMYLSFISSTSFSEDSADPKLKNVTEFWELITGMLHIAGIVNIADYFPLLKVIDPQGIRRRTSIRYRKGIKVFEEIIARRLELEMGNDLPSEENDMLDVLLNAIRENSMEVRESELPNILMELLVAGYDTTSIVLEWAMTELLQNPIILKKAQAELEKVVVQGKPVEERDIDRLPYLQAIVKETFRLHPPAPFLVPRKATIDVELSGFVVPKHSQVLVNIWSIGRNGSLWKDPNIFEPERFMGFDVDFKGHNMELIPFGAGRRMCPGLPIAQKTLHLILGSLLHSFDWKLERGADHENLDMYEKYGFTLAKAQNLRAVPTNFL